MDNNYNDEETKEFEPFRVDEDPVEEVEITDYSDDYEETEGSEESTEEVNDEEEVEEPEETETAVVVKTEDVVEEEPVETSNDEEDNDDENFGVNKKIIFIVGGVLAAFLIILLLIVLLLPKSSGSKKGSGDDNNTVTSNSNVSTITIIFDADGGEPVNSMQIDENTSITLPTTTKTGYKLEGWYLEETKVDDSTTYDKDTVLKAKWVKLEYTCPEGYTLKDKTCTIIKDANASCPNGTKEDGSNCVSLTDYKKADKKCPKQTIDGTSYEGVLTEDTDGTTVCWYAPVTTLTTAEACNAEGNTWNKDTCYKRNETNSDNMVITCEKEYSYYSKDDLQKKFNVTNMTEGCYKQSAKTYSCDKEFTLSNNKCSKTVDATEKQ